MKPAHVTTRRTRTAAAVGVAVLSLAACSSLPSWVPTIPAPSWSWFGGSKKLGPLPEIKATATAKADWQVQVGKARAGLAPMVSPAAVYAASIDGTLARFDPATGRQVWRVSVDKKLSAGVGADDTLVVVGTDKGEVIAYDVDGKQRWQAKVSSEVLNPPVVAEGIVAVWSGDARLYGLSAGDGKTKWVFQRASPPLTVRNYAGATASRGGLFGGTAGGKLLAMDVATGNVGWEANVATPKGATELERIADITSLPLVEERQICAVAYQGRVACFDILRGTLLWSRDVSSLDGLAADARYLFVTDDKGAVHALDKATGASVWKQDKLDKRRIGGPVLVGGYVGVVDGEGQLHLLDRNDGQLVGRLATDGTPATAQPVSSGGRAWWQSEGGTLYAVDAR
jgi:outer membrane protein assembly factor BamB